MKFTVYVFTAVMAGALLACQPSSDRGTSPEIPGSLKTAFEGDFLIGAALNRRQISGQQPASASLIREQFNAITAENIMKWMYIHPARDTFEFELADQFVALGEANGMFTVGHTLVWHSQLAPWVEAIEDSAAMAEVLEAHIQGIVEHFKGRIDGWDVVNEALEEDGSLRITPFLETMGPDYLPFAFKQAGEADPEAELYYNDYNLTQPAKRQGAIRLIKDLHATGAPIHGIGMQGHWGLASPSLAEIDQSIAAYAELGIKVMITELDVSVLPNPWDMEGAGLEQTAEADSIMNPYPRGLPDSVQTQLAQRYEDIFRIFLKHKDHISRVTFWGVNDGQSWKNNWPIRGRTNYPLLFDRQYQPKAAYERVIRLAAEAAATE